MYVYNSHELIVTRRDTYRTVISDIVHTALTQIWCYIYLI